MYHIDRNRRYMNLSTVIVSSCIGLFFLSVALLSTAACRPSDLFRLLYETSFIVDFAISR